MPKNKLFRPASSRPSSLFVLVEKSAKLCTEKVCRQKADSRIHHPFPIQPAIPFGWTLWTARGQDSTATSKAALPTSSFGACVAFCRCRLEPKAKCCQKIGKN